LWIASFDIRGSRRDIVGLDCIQVCFRHTDREAVIGAFCRAFPFHAAYVSPAVNGWVTLVSDKLDSFRETDLLAVGTAVSQMCNCDGVGLGVVRSDVFHVWVLGRSAQAPLHLAITAHGEPVDVPSEQIGIASTAIAQVAPGEVAPETVTEILARNTTYADTKLQDLGRQLGIAHVGISYRILLEEAEDLDDDFLPGWEQFRHVQGRMKGE
jgi:hypothetical protein